MTEDIMPYSDFSELPAVPSDSWTEDLHPLVKSLDPCDPFTGCISWEAFNPFELGLHSQSTPQSPHEDVGPLFFVQSDE